MATPVISPIGSPINFTVDTPVNLAVPISNDPFPVVLRGEVEELYYAWEDGVLYLRGTPTRTRAGRRLVIYATDAEDHTNTVESEFIYNVRNPAPMIVEIPAVRIVRGVEQSIFIPISNNPSEVAVEGLLVGLDHRRGEKDDRTGVFIVGRVPIDANFTTESGRFWINAENDGGSDSWGDSDSGGLGWNLARASLPAQVTALQASVSGTTVNLAWQAPNDGGTPIIRYEYQIDSGNWIGTDSTLTRFALTQLAERTSVYRIRVRAVNGLGAGPASATVSARVLNSPVIRSISNVSKDTGYSQFTIQASVSRGLSPTWSISGIAGATISSFGLITIPAGLSEGTYTATITASNSAGSDTETFSLSVIIPAVAPVFSSSSGTTTRSEGYSQFSFTISLSRGTQSTWSVSGITGATISNAGIITIPAGLSVGTYTATITASNSAGSATRTLTFTVEAAVAPEIWIADSRPSKVSGYDAFTIRTFQSAGSTISTWSISGISGATISDTGVVTIPAGLSVTRGRFSNSPHTATVTATNPAGSDTASIFVTVSSIPVPGAPVITIGRRTTSTIPISWGEAPSPYTPILEYRVRRYPSGTTTFVSKTATDRTHTFTGLTEGAEYEMTVVARNVSGWGTAGSVTRQTRHSSAPTWLNTVTHPWGVGYRDSTLSRSGGQYEANINLSELCTTVDKTLGIPPLLGGFWLDVRETNQPSISRGSSFQSGEEPELIRDSNGDIRLTFTAHLGSGRPVIGIWIGAGNFEGTTFAVFRFDTGQF